ncbi:MAG: RsmB/NOP family class I SAM-dependent RNA methyltransferase [Clostridium sp.]|nr:RsmB/NOP family class I SAM-dependent RNA methyltransferase [Clostridium sp.]
MSIKELKNYLPSELIDILEKIYTKGQLDMIYRSFYNGRHISFRVNGIKGNTNEVIDELRNKKIKAVNHQLIKNAFIIDDRKESELRNLESYVQGKIYISNISSMLPPLSLELEEDNIILDMCATPGDKSLFIADLTNNKATILSNDDNEIRRERLNDDINKYGASCIISFGSDACTIGKRLNKYFDRILLNAPCSVEGTYKYNSNKSFNNWSKKNISIYSKLQKNLIDSAYNALKPGGIIVYSTCALNPYENEEVINYILEKYKDLHLERINIDLDNVISGLIEYDEVKYNEELKNSIRIIPNDYMEGVFIAKLVKDKE